MKNEVTSQENDVAVCPDSEWIRRWQDDEAHWHKQNNDPFLVKNGATLIGEKKMRIFVPLCGKSHDLLWFYENGHEVIGVEIAEEPVKELYQGNAIAHSVQEIEDVGSVYKSDDGRLSIFVANIFNIPIETYGQFDVVWDNSSITAINKGDRTRYRDLMIGVMKPESVYYMFTMDYDMSVWPGPPHSISDKLVEEIFGNSFYVHQLEKTSTDLRSRLIAGNVDVDIGEGSHKQIIPELEAIANSPYFYQCWYKLLLK